MTTKFYLGKSEFAQDVFFDNNFEKSVFNLLTEFPFNNILHNQIKKYLMTIIESNNQPLLRKYFVDNSEFYSFLTHVVRHKHLVTYSAKKVKVGFVGQLVAVTTAILKNNELKDSLSERELTRPRVDQFHRQVLQERVRGRNPDPGRHRRQPRRREQRRRILLLS